MHTPQLNIPKLLVMQNLPSILYNREARFTPYKVKALERIQEFEQKIMNKADGVVFMSELDRSLANVRNGFVVPNGVDIVEFTPLSAPDELSKRNVLMLGTMTHSPNRDSMAYFLNDICLIECVGLYLRWFLCYPKALDLSFLKCDQ